MIAKSPDAVFDGGATRSHHALRYELVPKQAIDRLVKRLELGAEIHGADNWKKGGPEFVAETKRHMAAHLLNYLAGDGSDDHLGALICNAAFLCYFEEKNGQVG